MKKTFLCILYYLIITFIYLEFLSFHNFQGFLGLGTLNFFSFFSFLVLVFRIKKLGLSKIFSLIYVLGFLSFIILFFYVSRGYSWNKVLKWFKTWQPYVFQLLFFILALINNIPMFWYIKKNNKC